MKKIIALMLSVLMMTFMFSLTACSDNLKKGGDEPEKPAEVKKEGSIVVVGDSLMDFWENGETFLGNYFTTATNKAILATHVYDWYSADRNYPVILENSPTDVLIGVGINDIKAYGDVNECTDVLKDLFEKLKIDSPNLVIHYVSVSKCEAADFYADNIVLWNNIMREYCGQKGYYFIDTQDAYLTEEGEYDLSLFVDDKLHFSDAGYAVLENILGKHFYSYRTAE